jgi:serine/threonine protein kinase
VGRVLCRALDFTILCTRGVCGLKFHASNQNATRISTGHLSMQHWSDLCLGMMEAMQALHANGFVHGDVKTGNFCYANGKPPSMIPTVQLIDFGFSTTSELCVKDLWHARSFTGTADFASKSMLQCNPPTYADDLGAPWCEGG